jgi:exopolysaccharide biosynthesis polyprenyl glycosylphosphotransferase
MKRIEVLFGVLKVPLDAGAVFLALVVAYRLREMNIDLLPWIQLLTPPTTLPPFPLYIQDFALASVALFIALSAIIRLYAIKLTLGFWKEIQKIIIVACLWLAIIIAWYFLVQKQLFFSRILLLQATFLSVVFSVSIRGLLLVIQRELLERGIGIRTVCSFGRTTLPSSVERMLLLDRRYRYSGHCMDLTDMRKIASRKTIDVVLHTDANPKNDDTLSLIEYCRSHHIHYSFLPPVFVDVPHLLSVERFGVMPILTFEPTPLDGWGRVWKRLFDVIMSTLFIILLSPLLLLIGLLVLLTSGWPVLYFSKRIGQFARTKFPMIKFRTMVKDADARKEKLVTQSHRNDGPLFKMKNDPRVTGIGAFLRHWTLDEWPQLFNVLLGQMSLVGPRPHLPDEVDNYNDYARRVFTVKPGMTGLAQISGRSNLKFDDEVRLDLQYIEEWSLLLDMWIMWRTIFVVLKGDGAD